LDIIFLQETLGQSCDIERTLEIFLSGWKFSGLDAHDHSGGLALGINTRTIKEISCWGGSGFIGVDVYSVELGTPFRIVNIYGPFLNHPAFWDHVLDSKQFSTGNLIVGGDLNFSIGFIKSWG